MAIATDYPVVETGDRTSEFSRWRLRLTREDQTDRGRLYVVSTASGLELFKDDARQPGDLVASGVGGAGVVSLTEQNGSGVTGWVSRRSGMATNTVTVFVYLTSGLDLREFDEDADSMLTQGEVDFQIALREVSRLFLIQLSAEFPPPPSSGAPLRFVGEVQEAGVRGSPEWTAIMFWSLNSIGDWELTGLQNARDFRVWATYKALELIYDRKARGGQEDPVFQRARFWGAKAHETWRLTKPWVDSDGDLLPDRSPKIRSPRLRRG